MRRCRDCQSEGPIRAGLGGGLLAALRRDGRHSHAGERSPRLIQNSPRQGADRFRLLLHQRHRRFRGVLRADGLPQGRLIPLRQRAAERHREVIGGVRVGSRQGQAGPNNMGGNPGGQNNNNNNNGGDDGYVDADFTEVK